jgi:hypothetical protein
MIRVLLKRPDEDPAGKAAMGAESESERTLTVDLVNL